eukprot:TRINITY_DN3046_c0_g1_i2.p1 TRINITY_DN3046_c0_g1~~TRINITY_DN3046_c0_g1_i2.p1  ORF type:complete len:441 (+),score=109.39 TRINITY_DN3046_c0_g1_i2:102-1325(+)
MSKSAKQSRAPLVVEWERKPPVDLRPNWLEIGVRDQGEDAAFCALQDIIQLASDILYQRFLEKRVVPFAAQQAKRDVLALTQYLFFEHDAGEHDTDHERSWLADQEAAPIAIDSWARGVVPVQRRPVSAPAGSSSSSRDRPLTGSSRTTVHGASRAVSRNSQRRLKPPTGGSHSGGSNSSSKLLFAAPDGAIERTSSGRPDATEASSGSAVPPSPASSLPMGAAAAAASSPAQAVPPAVAVAPKSTKPAAAASAASPGGGKAAAAARGRKAAAAEAANAGEAEQAAEARRLAQIKAETRGRAYTYDCNGELIVINAVDPDSLPTHKPSLQVSVVESASGGLGSSSKAQAGAAAVGSNSASAVSFDSLKSQRRPAAKNAPAVIRQRAAGDDASRLPQLPRAPAPLPVK